MIKSLQGDILSLSLFLTWTSFIGQYVHTVGGEGEGVMGVSLIWPSARITLLEFINI